MVRTEIFAGARPGEDAEVSYLLNRLRWLDVGAELADRAGRLAATYRRSHSVIDTVEFLLAAATQELNAQLLTLNVKHFPMFPGLKPAY